MQTYNYIDHPKNSCIVVDKKQLIFINVPKCATKSIKKELKGYNSFETNLNQLTPEQQNYYKFTFIREPIKRFLSGYMTIIFKSDNVSELCKSLPFWNITDKYKRFESFCDSVKEHGFFDCHIAPLDYFLEDFTNIDYVGCLETYSNDINYIFNKFDIKYKKIIKHQKSQWGKQLPDKFQYNIEISDLTPEQLAFIEQIYKVDLDLYQQIINSN